MLLSREILEHILQFADGKTLLTCKEVSPEFEETVNYLSHNKNIWKKCYSEEKGDKYPYSLISKLYPHNEGLNYPKNWAIIYETSVLASLISCPEKPYLSHIRLGTEYSEIIDLETHGDLILVLVKYNKSFSIYYKIIIVNLENQIVFKTCQFFSNTIYITPIKDVVSVRPDSILLSCSLCHLIAVPVCADRNGYPKFDKNDEYLTIEHASGEVLWVNNFGHLISKGKCFHSGRDSKHEEIKLKDSLSIKIFHRYTSLFMACHETKRELNTFQDLKANVTASFHYSNVLILGTDTGVLYAYFLNGESDLKTLSLKNWIWKFDVCSDAILLINVSELPSEFLIVCCCEKSLYQVHIRRKLRNFNLKA